MLWRTHVLAGISSLWLLEAIPPGTERENLALLIRVAAFGALLPDLDAAQSKIKHLSIARIKPFYLPARAIHQQFGHRGFSHSLAAVGLVALLSFGATLIIDSPYAAEYGRACLIDCSCFKAESVAAWSSLALSAK
jgi:membrane-bound metal-dependent hydrolase YbcI (DUF457 family)